MPGRIFVTGASGFVGSAVVQQLLSRGYLVNALIHRKPLDSSGRGVTSIQGDLFDTTALQAALRDCAAVIHLVGIIRENPSRNITFERLHTIATRRVVDAAKSVGIRRYLHMSALGTRPNAPSHYHQTKHLAEEYVRSSGLDWTIFRPSLIHGPHGEFMRMEAAWARRQAPPFLFMPYFGAGLTGRGGAGHLQPVYVHDVARAFVDALENPATIGKTYPLAGPRQYTWPDLHRAAAQILVGHPRLVLPLPVWKAKLLTRLLPPSLLPFNRDQILMSQEDNTADLTPFRRDFPWEPRGFEETLAEYANQL